MSGQINPTAARMASRTTSNCTPVSIPLKGPKKAFEPRKKKEENPEEEDPYLPYKNVLLFFAAGLVVVTSPFIIYRYILNIDTNCTYRNRPEGDETAPSVDVEDSYCDTSSHRLGHGLYLYVTSFLGVGFYILEANMTLGPHGKRKSLRIWPFIALLSATVCILPHSSIILVSYMQIILGVLIPVLEHKEKINRGGMYLVGFYTVQYMVIFTLISLAQPYIHNEFVLGFRYTVFFPIVTQLNQGLGIMIKERLSPICPITKKTKAHVIFSIKYQMMFLNTFKMVSLLAVVKYEENAIRTLIFNAFLDMIGRNQIWRMLIRKTRKVICHRKKKYSKLSFLSQTALCSELDMDYLPLVIVTAMNALQTPLLNSMYTYHHFTGNQMKLVENSLLRQSWSNIGILYVAIILGDVLTIGLGKLIYKYRVYDMQYVFSHSRKWSMIYGSVYSASCIATMCALGHLVGEQNPANESQPEDLPSRVLDETGRVISISQHCFTL